MREWLFCGGKEKHPTLMIGMPGLYERNFK